MTSPLSKTFIEQMVRRAQDAARRTDTSALAANSGSVDDLFAEMRAPLDALSAEQQEKVREYTQGINVEGPMKAIMQNAMFGDGSLGKGLFAALASMTGGVIMAGPGSQTFAMGPKTEARPAAPPASEEAIAAAEAALGFALPAELRQFYAEVADGGVGMGDGIYNLEELAAKYCEMTRGPVGPQGQEWPANLLPILGDNWDLVSIDRETGKLVFWDLEDLDDDEDLPADNPTWAKSFRHEADSLEDWLTKWDEAD